MKTVFKHLIGGASVALGMVVLGAPTVRATVLDFSFSGNLGGGVTETASWSMDSNPNVITFTTGSFTLVTTSGGTEFRSDLVPSTSTFDAVQFDAPGVPSGVEFNTVGVAFNVFDRFGSQIYTGSESAPVFAPGTFVGTLGTLTITDAVTTAVPEPSTWAMMLLGFLGLGLMTYRRNSKTALNAA
jgi:PEP-CTERM motif